MSAAKIDALQVGDRVLVTDDQIAEIKRQARMGALLEAEHAILNNGQRHLSRADAAWIVRGIISQTESKS